MTPVLTIAETIPNNPQRIDRRGDAQLVGRVFGNVHLEYPQITREMVAARLTHLREQETAARDLT